MVYPQVIHKLRITYVNVDFTGFVVCGKVPNFFQNDTFGSLDIANFIRCLIDIVVNLGKY